MIKLMKKTRLQRDPKLPLILLKNKGKRGFFSVKFALKGHLKKSQASPSFVSAPS